MISKKISEAINRQINREFYSAYLYFSMASYFESINLRGFAHWMEIQSKEELSHGKKLYSFLIERGGRSLMQDIEAPPSEWTSPTNAFEDTYNHERAVTEMINELVNLAKDEKDHATAVFLQWFIKEQVEEEASSDEIIQKLKMVGEKGHALFMIDRELAQRKSD
jgi:ferritin